MDSRSSSHTFWSRSMAAQSWRCSVNIKRRWVEFMTNVVLIADEEADCSDSSDDWDRSSGHEYCGLSRNFLQRPSARVTGVTRTRPVTCEVGLLENGVLMLDWLIKSPMYNCVDGSTFDYRSYSIYDNVVIMVSIWAANRIFCSFSCQQVAMVIKVLKNLFDWSSKFHWWFSQKAGNRPPDFFSLSTIGTRLNRPNLQTKSGTVGRWLWAQT